MKLSWRDVFTTIFAAGVVVALVAALLGYDWSLFGTWRGAVGTVGVLGVLMVLFDETDFTRFNSWSAVEGLLTLAGIGLAIAGLIATSKVLFVLLAADALAFWLVSISRHEFSNELIAPRSTMQST